MKKVVVQTMTHGAETWSMRMEERRKLDVMELKCLQSMCSVIRKDRWRNDEVTRGVCVRKEMSDRVNRQVLELFRQVERMSGERLTKRVYQFEVGGRRDRGRSCMKWLDGVKKACNARLPKLKDAKM